MSHDGIFATSSEIVTHAGANYNSTFVTEAKINELCLQVEAQLCNLMNYDLVTNWASLNAIKKKTLSALECAYVATHMIKADIGAYNSQLEAQTMLDVLDELWKKNLELLQSTKVRDGILTA